MTVYTEGSVGVRGKLELKIGFIVQKTGGMGSSLSKTVTGNMGFVHLDSEFCQTWAGKGERTLLQEPVGIV